MFGRRVAALLRSDLFVTIARWFDSSAGLDRPRREGDQGIDWVRCIPFIAIHLACLGVLWVGWSWIAVGTALALYLARMFAITAFFHRYFSHRTFSTSRPVQFLFALLGASAAQRGPLWWAAHHRHHHANADTEADVHSPARHGFLWSHLGWFMTRANFPTRWEYVRDWAKVPELVWLNRFDILTAYALALLLFAAGSLLAAYAPSLGTNGLQMVVWGFVISTVLLFHATFTINSLDHMIGTRRYDTKDTSRNNPALALITLGEGWHNNHHHYPITVRQGFYWWEIDLAYYLLVLLSWFGLVRNLRGLPARIRSGEGAWRCGGSAAGAIDQPPRIERP